jgi:pilus assembly protein CpaE
VTMEQLENKIRVLIVDDIPETRENVRKLLYFEKDIEVVGAAANGTGGIEMSRSLRPDIVLMDINMPDIDGISATESISQSVPEVQIIMMSVQGETDYLRRSMLAGAREFLVKPFSADELIASIRRVHQLKPRPVTTAPEILRPSPAGPAAGPASPVAAREGAIVTVYSPKGGSGCSTIATNLALALHDGDSKAALVDGDMQFGDVAVLLNLQASRTITDIIPHIDSLDADFLNDVMLTHPSGMKILLAPPRPDAAEMVRADDMRTVLRHLSLLYDYTVVDTASYLDDIVLTILEVSDWILLIATPDIPSIKNIRLTLEALDALDYLSKTRLVINLAGGREGIAEKDIATHIKHPIFATIPRDNGIVSIAANQGVPVMVSNQKSVIAKSILHLAELMRDENSGATDKKAGRQGTASQAAGRKRLFGRILS